MFGRILLLAVAAPALVFFVLSDLRGAQTAAPVAAAYICPMHPDVRGMEGETCARCGMRLVRSAPRTLDASAVELTFRPRAVRPRAPAVISVGIRDPGAGTPVTDLEAVHERPIHLFIVDQEFASFAHLHPSPASGGVFEAGFSVPHAGVYHAFVEFMPRGGTPQLVHRTFFTADYRGGVTPGHLAPDIDPQVDHTLTVRLQLPADGLVAGREQTFRCSLSDATSGRPIRDLQPYLGTLGHAFVVSADLDDAAHLHPIPEFSDAAGPNLVFEAMFPRPGMYRVWIQFQRAQEVFVTAFSVPVRPE